MRCLNRLCDGLNRIPVGVWLFLAVTQIGTIVGASVRSGKSIYTPDSLPILNEEYRSIIMASILGTIFVGFSLLRWRFNKSDVANTLQRWRLFLGVSLIAIIVALVALSIVEWWQDKAVRIEATSDAEEWLSKAQSEVKPTWMEDDAVAWMKRNDFDLTSKGEGWRSSVGQPDEHYYLAKGEKKLKNAGLLVEPAWMEMTFIFNLNNHRYERVEYTIQRYRFRLPNG
jgi:hypothetical protein